MRKTFCDRCSGECVNRVVILEMHEVETTNQGQMVGEREFRAIELCALCGDEIKKIAVLDIARFAPQYDQPVAEDTTVAEDTAESRPVPETEPSSYPVIPAGQDRFA